MLHMWGFMGREALWFCLLGIKYGCYRRYRMKPSMTSSIFIIIIYNHSQVGTQLCGLSRLANPILHHSFMVQLSFQSMMLPCHSNLLTRFWASLLRSSCSASLHPSLALSSSERRHQASSMRGSYNRSRDWCSHYMLADGDVWNPSKTHGEIEESEF